MLGTSHQPKSNLDKKVNVTSAVTKTVRLSESILYMLESRVDFASQCHNLSL